MTALLVVRQGLDWTGLVVVLGMLAVVLAVARLEARDAYRRAQARCQGLIDTALDTAVDTGLDVAEPDHVDCSNPDCDQVICACRKPAECTGCTTLGCTHGEGLCWDCRRDCRECAFEDDTQQAIDWANGR